MKRISYASWWEALEEEKLDGERRWWQGNRWRYMRLILTWRSPVAPAVRHAAGYTLIILHIMICCRRHRPAPSPNAASHYHSHATFACHARHATNYHDGFGLNSPTASYSNFSHQYFAWILIFQCILRATTALRHAFYFNVTKLYIWVDRWCKDSREMDDILTEYARDNIMPWIELYIFYDMHNDMGRI